MEDDKFLAQQKEVAFLRKIDEDLDYAFALSLQEEENDTSFLKKTSNNGLHHQPSDACVSKSTSSPLGIVDEQWEVIDPNPDIHALFLQYNAQFFYGKLEGVEVRWSPRMTLCAGVCCYEGRGGLCSVRLSVPLLKLRPRKDLVETLLHEMIHAYLFVTVNNKDRDAHGPEFLKHMYRINKEAGTKISVYHSFHDEVDLYRKHWWKCNGPCQKKRPFFGLVKRAMNRAPGPHDTWWSQHQASCGGEFIKIKEPENFKKKSLKRKPLEKPNSSQDIKKFLVSPSSEDDFSKDVCSTSKESKVSDDIDFIKSILGKEDNCILMNNGITNSSSALKSTNSIIPFSGQGFQLGSTSSAQPRSFLANIRKELASSSNNTNVNSPTKNFHSAFPLSSSNLKEPMSKDIKKDTVVNSLLHKKAVMTENDCSGFVQSSIEKFVKPPTGISKSKNSPMISEVQIVQESRSIKVECPVCFQSFTNLDINTHLDSCLS